MQKISSLSQPCCILYHLTISSLSQPCCILYHLTISFYQNAMVLVSHHMILYFYGDAPPFPPQAFFCSRKNFVHFAQFVNCWVRQKIHFMLGFGSPINHPMIFAFYMRCQNVRVLTVGFGHSARGGFRG